MEFLDRTVNFVLVKLLRINISADKLKIILQFARFGLIGLSNTLISYIIYVLFLLLFQKQGIFPDLDYLLAQLIGFLISVLWSFYWNKKYVFHDEDGKLSWIQALLKTYASYAFTGIFLNSLLSILWVQKLGVPKIAAPIINLLISVPLNFILNKFWAFRKNK